MENITTQMLKKMDIQQLERTAEDIRQFLIRSVADTGGHLASNLGVVELTLAIHYVFDLPHDKVVWDVGHQAYVHKILSGRMDAFDTLRQFGGLSGFPKRGESPYDCFDTGHSSTSLSAALGMARARDLMGAHYDVVSVIGDGALTGGMAFEALNDAGEQKTGFIVILNDNEMSISRNVGSMSTYLTSLRAKPSYHKFKQRLERLLKRIPVLGRPTYRALKKIKDGVRHLLTRNTLFEQLGFVYLGPTDGHNISALIKILKTARQLGVPVLIHTFTTKGKGYKFAEERPAAYHGVGRFSVETGKSVKPGGGDTYSSVFGRELVRLGVQNDKLCAVTAAMPDGTGLTPFAKAYPARFFDVGIAEQHAVTFSAGLAASGMVPVFAVYSSFLQRAYDQVLHDVCLQNLKVVLAIDRAGLVGEDGETHQGLFDLAFLYPMANIAILAPSGFEQLTQMLDYAVHTHDGPIAIRYPRGNAQCGAAGAPFQFGKACELAAGSDVCILCVGHMCATGLAAAKLLHTRGISAAVVDLRTVKPLDAAFIHACGDKYELVVTLEDGVRDGGVGEHIAAMLHDAPCGVLVKAHNDPIVPQGKVGQLYAHSGLDAESVCADIIKQLKRRPNLQRREERTHETA